MKKQPHIEATGNGSGHKPTDSSQPYAEDSALTWVFGSHPEVRLVSATLIDPTDEEPAGDLNMESWDELADINRNYHHHYDELETFDILTHRKMGQNDLYGVVDSPIRRALQTLEQTIIAEEFGQSETTNLEDANLPSEPDGNDEGPGTELDEPYAEGTPLTWIFGDHPGPKILAALLSEPEYELTITDIAQLAGLSRTPVYNRLESPLLEYRIIETGRKIGGSTTYKLNNSSPIVMALTELEDELLSKYYRDIVETPD